MPGVHADAVASAAGVAQAAILIGAAVIAHEPYSVSPRPHSVPVASTSRTWSDMVEHGVVAPGAEPVRHLGPYTVSIEA